MPSLRSTGEYKIWILKHYLASSVHYYLAIDDILEGTIQKLHSKVNNLPKKWLGLPRSTTQAVLYHPDVLDLHFFSHFSLRAKMDYLRVISTSNDPLLKELASCLCTNLPDFCPPQCLNLLQAARTSISPLPPSSNPNAHLKQVSKLVVRDYQASHWDNHLDSLTVQSKFKDIIALEPDCKVWNRILSGLPAGHLSFILKAGADCLPTSLNLRRWKFQTDPKCPLCSSPLPTSAHILNQCPTALNQGRYTWRHDSVLRSFVKSLTSYLLSSEKLYADLPGKRASNNPPATLPLNLSVSADRPDVVVVSDRVIRILELTIPTNNTNHLLQAKHRKEAKYYSLPIDLQSHPDVSSVSYSTLEVGSLGHYLPSAIQTLQLVLPTPH